jgi:hypothetical protein
LQVLLKKELERANGQKSQLGDVQQRLKNLEMNPFAKRAPKAMNAPFIEQ